MSKQTKTILLFWGYLAVAVGVALPFWARVDRRSKRSCYATMAMIEGAKITWMMDYHKGTNDIPAWSDLVGPDRYLQEIPQCPHGGTCTPGKVGDPPTCSVQEDTAYFWRNH